MELGVRWVAVVGGSGRVHRVGGRGWVQGLGVVGERVQVGPPLLWVEQPALCT